MLRGKFYSAIAAGVILVMPALLCGASPISGDGRADGGVDCVSGASPIETKRDSTKTKKKKQKAKKSKKRTEGKDSIMVQETFQYE